jgi:hypothetical protein
MPEVHDAIATEAQERLAALIPADVQERLNVEFVLRTGPAAEELVRYTNETTVDLAIVQLRGTEDDSGPAHALLEHGRCAVLILR